eukprot:3833693-Rhodomonas_salina.1
MRRKRGGFLPALLAPVAGALIGKAINGIGRCKRKGRGVYLHGSGRPKGRGVYLHGSGMSRRGGSIMGKLKRMGSNFLKDTINKIKKDPVGSATKAFKIGYKGSGRRTITGSKRQPRRMCALLRGVHTSAPASKTTPTISFNKLQNVPKKSLSVSKIKKAKRF